MHVIRYRDRTIDLKPYFEGFPFFNFIFNEEDGFLYYFFRRQQIHLYRTELKHEPDLQNGRRVSELDFSVFNSWDWRYHAPSRSFLFLGDENNDERINIYRLDIDTGAKICLTKEEYIYGYGISSDENRIYFTAR